MNKNYFNKILLAGAACCYITATLTLAPHELVRKD